MKIIIYIGDADRCPPCREFKNDFAKIDTVFKKHDIMFVEARTRGDIILPISNELYDKLMKRRDNVLRIPQFHFYEVDGEDIVKYKGEAGYSGTYRFIMMMVGIFKLTNKTSK